MIPSHPGSGSTGAREQSKYVQLDREHWPMFFDHFSHENVGKSVEAEIDTPEIGTHELVRHAPLVGITASSEHGPDMTIELIFSPDRDGHLSHTIHQPTRVTLGPEDVSERWLEIESAQGEVLTLHWHESKGEAAPL